MNRQVEFCKGYRQRIVDCLNEDNLMEEYAFALILIELCIRQKEASLLTWEQIDFDDMVIKDIQISKINPEQPEVKRYYDDRHMSYELYRTLHNLREDRKIKTGKIFNTNPMVYQETIRKSVGDISLRSHMLRQIGITLKMDELRL